jgi:hypothetical protein
MSFFVYALIDPSTFSVRYVGSTTDVRSRFRDHAAEWRRHSGAEPVCVILERLGSERGMLESEARWIDIFTVAGQVLDNRNAPPSADGNRSWVGHSIRLSADEFNRLDATVQSSGRSRQTILRQWVLAGIAEANRPR